MYGVWNSSDVCIAWHFKNVNYCKAAVSWGISRQINSRENVANVSYCIFDPFHQKVVRPTFSHIIRGHCSECSWECYKRNYVRKGKYYELNFSFCNTEYFVFLPSVVAKDHLNCIPTTFIVMLHVRDGKCLNLSLAGRQDSVGVQGSSEVLLCLFTLNGYYWGKKQACSFRDQLWGALVSETVSDAECLQALVVKEK